MTLIAVPIAVDTPEDIPFALNSAIDAQNAGAHLIEWRIDTLALTGLPADVVRLAAESPLPCIVTCRSHREGGRFEGHDALRRDIISALATSENPPRYIDIELSTMETDPSWRDFLRETIVDRNPGRDRAIGIIVSSHDFDGRPADLLRRVEAIAREPFADITKLAWRARSLRDNLEAFELLDNRQKPSIALCMGEFGLMSRVLAPKHGGMLTFASLRGGLESAPGQPSVHDLLTVYRIDQINPETRLYGVIGWPVAHSRGPAIHNAGFAAIGHNGVYLPLPIPTEYEHFKATLIAMLDDPRLRFAGASVTLPHKSHLVRFVNEIGGSISALALRIGAANTLVIDDDGPTCLNTDAPAVVSALRRGIPDDAPLAGRSALVLGAGGVARAAVAGLADADMSITIANRTSDRAHSLLADLELTDAARVGNLDTVDGHFDVIVNATSVGMIGGPDPDSSPLPDRVKVDDTVAVLDTVYTPADTPLLVTCRERGAMTIDGRAMFLTQAAMQFEAWTETPAPLDVFQDAMNTIA